MHAYIQALVVIITLLVIIIAHQCAKNIGFWLDSGLKFDKQIT